MLDPVTPHWIVAYTAPRLEKRVAQRLSERGIENYLPLLKQRRKWSDRIKIVETPLFGSYIFARIVRGQLAAFLNTDGIVIPISFNHLNHNDLAIVPDEQIQSVRRLVDAEQQLFLRQESMHKGIDVIVREGPLAGMRGTLLSDCDEGNFSIRIEAINTTLVTQIDQQLLDTVE